MAAGPITSLMATSLQSQTARNLLTELDDELMALYPDHPYPPPFGDAEALGVGSVLIAYSNESAVGCGAVQRIDDETAELLRMYVLPSARGHGVGKALLAWLEEEAIDLGVSRLVLEAGDRQPDAVGLYESRGYSKTVSWKSDPNPHSVFMEKRVSSSKPHPS